MPFCPECSSEYVDGVTECSDCSVKLVAALPEDPGEPDVQLVQVWECYGEISAQLVHSLLQSFGIESFLKGEAIRYIHGFTLDGLGRVRVLVRADEAEKAKEILADVQGDIECPECGNSIQPQDAGCPLCGKAV